MELNEDYIRSKFQSLSDIELIRFLELDWTEYSPVAVDIANREFASRNLLPESIQKLALMMWQEYINKNIKQILFRDKEIHSRFCTQEEMIELVKVSIKFWKNRQELLNVDSTKYWAGIL